MAIDAANWRAPRWRFVLALSAALIIHIVMLVMVREALRWQPSFDARMATPMQLRLIDVELVPPPPPQLVPKPELAAASAPMSSPPVTQLGPAAAPPVTVKAEEGKFLRVPEAGSPVAATEASVSSHSEHVDQARISSDRPVIVSNILTTAAPSPTALAEPAPLRPQRERQPRLVTPNGRVYLPEVDVAVAAAAARFPVRPMAPATGASSPFSHRSPVPYVATRFDRLWVPDGETLLGSFLRKLSDKLIKKSSTEVAGLQIDCVWVLVVAGCSWGVPPRISIDELKKMRADVPMQRGPRTQPGG